MKRIKKLAAGNKTLKKSIKRYFPIFMLPTLIAFVIGFVWPFLWGIYLSFFKFKTLKFIEFNGFNNYILAFQDSSFLNAFKFTSIFAVVAVILINLCAFFLALALTSKVKGSTIFRTIFFMPNLIGGIVLGYIWNLLINSILGLFGFDITYDADYGPVPVRARAKHYHTDLRAGDQ